MGPYCKFCNNRCFAYICTLDELDHAKQQRLRPIIRAYGHYSLAATCPQGQDFDKAKVGYCYDDIQTALSSSVEQV